MLHLTKRKDGKFEVVNVGENGEMLSSSVQGFETKAGCYKNMRSRMKSTDNTTTKFQDDTFVNPRVYMIYTSDKANLLMYGHPIRPKYIPGKNPRKKKAGK